METIWPAPFSVVEKLPREKQRVLWFDGEWCIGVRNDSKLDGEQWWEPEGHWDMLKITPNLFWMPLPAEPNPTE